MKILFIGGTGIISSACSQLALDRGIDLYLHSFILDNAFRIACGFAVRFGQIQDDPVISDQPDFKLLGVRRISEAAMVNPAGTHSARQRL